MADKTKELRQIHLLVKDELLEHPQTRQNDLFINNVLNRMGIDTSRSFRELATNGQLRHAASITRARRKLQEKHPELKDIATAEIRAEHEEIFRRYANDQI